MSRPDGGSPSRAYTRQDCGQQNAQHNDDGFLDGERIIWPDERPAGKNVLEQLGMDLDARHGRIERRSTQVEQARRTRSHQNDAPGDVFPRHLSGEDLPGRNVGRRVAMAKLNDNSPICIGRNFEIADLEVIKTGIAAESRLTAGIGRLQDIRACVLRNPHQFGGKRGHQFSANPVEHGHAPDDLVTVGQPVDGSDAVRRIFENSEISARAGV